MAKVKVKILKFVGAWKPGDEVDMEEAQAAQLCKVVKLDTGGGDLVGYQKAMLVSDAVKLKTRKVDMNKVTQKQMADMGRRNIVPTPIGDAFDKKVAKVVEAAKGKAAVAQEKASAPAAKPQAAPDKK